MMLNKLKLKKIVGLMLFMLISAGVSLVTAVIEPEGPSTLTIDVSTTRTAYPAPTLEAYAGNVSHLTVGGSTATQSWQGYVGNITGTITLDDSSNYTLYDWTVLDPEGEIYATYLSSVDWSTGNVLCWNWSTGAASYLQLYELETNLTGGTGDGTPNDYAGIRSNATDVDGVDETFSALGGGTHSAFYVAGQSIAADSCHTTDLYNSTGGGVFQELLLYYGANSGNGDGVIYTSILQSDGDGYDTNTWDFELIVGEDGHLGNTATQTYYFYVELE